MSTTIGLKLEPLDVLFFRDGRPFGAATRGQSGLPLPQTLAGAVWTALLEQHGCDFSRLAAAAQSSPEPADFIRAADGPAWVSSVRTRGPWLARVPPEQDAAAGPWEVLVPVPAALHRPKRVPNDTPAVLPRLRPLRPGKLPGWQQMAAAEQHGLWPLWLRSRDPTEVATGFLTGEGLCRFLAGDPVGMTDLVSADELYELDHRTGIGINPDRLSAEEGLIYGASFLALKPGVFLYGEVILPDGCDTATLGQIETLAFGGEGRRVRASVLKQGELYRWPEKMPQSPHERPMLLLTTPGIFTANWKPACLNDRLLAAAVPGAVAVSGWDLARAGPKPTRFAAPGRQHVLPGR